MLENRSLSPFSGSASCFAHDNKTSIIVHISQVSCDRISKTSYTNMRVDKCIALMPETKPLKVSCSKTGLKPHDLVVRPSAAITFFTKFSEPLRHPSPGDFP